MNLRLTNDPGRIAAMINAFDDAYQKDYVDIRPYARAYLECASNALVLAPLLLSTLVCWGANKRSAPRCRSVQEVVHALADPRLHRMLVELAGSFPFLQRVGGICGIEAGAPFASVVQFERCLIGTLHRLADILFDGATNVTYPTKALLLITGLMPALDGEVRGGMKVAGLSGVGKYPFPLPRKECAGIRKLCMLPFLVAECVAHDGAVLDRAIAMSGHRQLAGHYGRVFDILLFMQGRLAPNLAVIRYAGSRSGRRWYKD